MKFQINEKKVTLPENVHAYAEKKVSKLDRYFRDDAEAFVAFSVEKNRNKVELTVHASNMYFRASESTSDMFASIDAAVSDIERQIRKNKTRLARRLRQDAFVRSAEVTSFVPEVEDTEDYKLIRIKEFAMMPMSRDEAILQMNMVGHKFYMFTDAESGEVNVVYLRDDGKYGLLQPTAEE